MMKNHLLAILALLISTAVCAQNKTYNLTVKLAGLKGPASAYLITQYGWSNSKTIDSAQFKGEEVKFTGDISDPFKVTLLVNHGKSSGSKWAKDNDVLTFYLESGSLSISGADSIYNAKVSGSKLNAAFANYQKNIEHVSDSVTKAINATYAAAPADKKLDKGFQSALMAQFHQASKRMDSLRLIYIKQHSDSFISLDALAELIDHHTDPAKTIPLYKGLSKSVLNSAKGKSVGQLLDISGPTSIGSLAPDFTQNDVNDKPVKLSDFRGKYVLLDFWASWCGPCRAENPNVLKAYNQYKDKNFTVLGVSLDQPGKKAAWLAAIQADGLPWTQVSDLQFWNNAIARQYGIRSIPQNFLIDPSGKIIAKNLRGEALAEKLASLLK